MKNPKGSLMTIILNYLSSDNNMLGAVKTKNKKTQTDSGALSLIQRVYNLKIQELHGVKMPWFLHGS